MLLADVVVDIPVRTLDAPYTYIVPNNLEGADGSFALFEDNLRVDVGCAVLVPFSGSKRREIAFVVSVYEGTPPEGAKYISKILSKPFFSRQAADCAMFLAQRYVAPLATCIRLFIPNGAAPKMVRSSSGLAHLQDPTVKPLYTQWIKLVDFNYEPRANAKVQKAILLALREANNNELALNELSECNKNASSAVTALESARVVVRTTRRLLRFSHAVKDLNSDCASNVPKPFVLTEGQNKALACIENALSNAAGEVVLVDGVTGSGKTEVYLRAIQKVIDNGKSAIVLVPEISLTPQTVARFRSRFGDSVAVLHSAMSAGERFDMWDYIQSGNAKVVVGARSALFAPLQNVGIVIIDEEHESTYKQESAPRYHARDVAIWMMRRSGGVVVLGSATPSIESLYSAKYDSLWHYAKMPQRAGGATLPKIDVVDMSLEFRDENRSIFSTPLKQAIQEEINAGNKIILLLNQRGFASFMICKECGFVPTCVHCSTSLTLHADKRALMCHHCGYTVVVPGVCPVCGSPYMRASGVGTERVQAELEGIVDVPVIRMDADTTAVKGSHKRLLDEFSQTPGSSILLGTQMIAKGLDFEDVTLVGVINADVQLNLPDFRANERTFALISQVSGRAGRSQKPGRVIIQTQAVDAPAIKYAALYNRKEFLNNELRRRQALKLPPYTKMSNVIVSGRDWRAVEQVANAAYSLLSEIKSKRGLASALETPSNMTEAAMFEIFPPCECVVSQKSNNYRMHVLMKASLNLDMSDMLREFKFKLKPFSGVSVAIDVDPFDLL